MIYVFRLRLQVHTIKTNHPMEARTDDPLKIADLPLQMNLNMHPPMKNSFTVASTSTSTLAPSLSADLDFVIEETSPRILRDSSSSSLASSLCSSHNQRQHQEHQEHQENQENQEHQHEPEEESEDVMPRLSGVSVSCPSMEANGSCWERACVDARAAASTTTLVFAYGSLMWRPAAPFTTREPACVRGFVRRFWQLSQDHRGTTEFPGRVAALVTCSEARSIYQQVRHQDSKTAPYGQTKREIASVAADESSATSISHEDYFGGDTVWGYVYELPADQRDELLSSMDRREKNGYTRTCTEAFNKDGLLIGECFVYRCELSNPVFSACLDDDAVAAQIAKAAGPSGPNIDYLLRLKDSLDRMHVNDPYIDNLVFKCKNLPDL